jgi:hypothetical protein
MSGLTQPDPLTPFDVAPPQRQFQNKEAIRAALLTGKLIARSV